MVVISWLGPALSVGLLLLIIFLILTVGKRIIWFIINGIVGIVLLWLVNFLPGVNIPFTLWNIVITAIGGLLGLIILVILNVTGIVL